MSKEILRYTNMSAAWFRMQGLRRIDMHCAGMWMWLVGTLSGERSNRTMSWGDPMAGVNGRLIAINQPVIIAIITITACRQVVVLVNDHPHRNHRIVGTYRCHDAKVARRSTIIDRLLCRELQRMHVQCAVPRIAYASHL
jgi:hypothetical protein